METDHEPRPTDGQIMRLSDCRLFDLPRIQDFRGNLTFIESSRHVPFSIERAYYLYDVPGGATRGGHGHKALHQLMIAIAGSFDVTLDDGNDKRRYHLNRSYVGLYIPPMIWRELDNFSSGSVCMVLASERYEEADYLRTYDDYLQFRASVSANTAARPPGEQYQHRRAG